MAKPVTGELAFLRALRARVGEAKGQVRIGIGDDCSVLTPAAGTEVVVTTDFSLEGRHFLRKWHSGTAAGHRCLARGLSDLAAMGAKPLAAFLSLALPAGTLKKAAERRWIDDFFTGLLHLAAHYGVPLAGGDLSTAPGEQILADIVLTGTVPRGRSLLRSGAKPGDGIYVSGTLGGAAAELEALRSSPKRLRHAKSTGHHPHLFPIPRIEVGLALQRRRLATAAMDISDGLSLDLARLCEESRVSAVIQASALPLGGTLEQALHGGEDYELLFTASRPMPRHLHAVPLTRIGTILPRSKSSLLSIEQDGVRMALTPHGWEHGL